VQTRYFEPSGNGVRLRVRVKPRASKSRVLCEREGELEVAVAAPPVDGAANEALVRVLSEYFGVPRSAVTIARGERGGSKLIEIDRVPEKLR
jgi:uncharacterized protein (TIGR00251 family)